MDGQHLLHNAQERNVRGRRSGGRRDRNMLKFQTETLSIQEDLHLLSFSLCGLVFWFGLVGSIHSFSFTYLLQPHLFLKAFVSFSLFFTWRYLLCLEQDVVWMKNVTAETQLLKISSQS
jgi:hypothetical protein